MEGFFINNKNIEKKTFKDIQQENLNFLMFKMKSLFEANNAVIVEWSDNYFVFKEKHDLHNAIELYHHYDNRWQELVSHKMKFFKDENKMKFVFENKKPSRK